MTTSSREVSRAPGKTGILKLRVVAGPRPTPEAKSKRFELPASGWGSARRTDGWTTPDWALWVPVDISALLVIP